VDGDLLVPFFPWLYRLMIIVGAATIILRDYILRHNPNWIF
jgi:hypothetical protein